MSAVRSRIMLVTFLTTLTFLTACKAAEPATPAQPIQETAISLPLATTAPTASPVSFDPLPASIALAFTSERDGNMDLYAMNVDRANPMRFTDNPASDRQPVWSPDRKQVVFICGSPSGGFNIFVMDANA